MKNEGSLKGWFNNVGNKILKWWDSCIPGGSIFTIALVVDTFALLHGAGVLFTGVVSGIALNLSISFILMATPFKYRSYILKGLAKHGFIIDLVTFVSLVYLGFQVGPTAACIGMFLSLNFSALVSLIRWSYFLNNVGERNLFHSI